MERPERHIDLFDYLNKAGPIKEPVVRDVFIQVPSRFPFFHISYSQSEAYTSQAYPLRSGIKRQYRPKLEQDEKLEPIASGP